MSLPDALVAVHRCLAEAHVRHAFGGALALAYYSEPRATADIDVNVFVPCDRIDEVIDALRPLGFEPLAKSGPRLPIAGVRVCNDEGIPVDLFCSTDDTYIGVAERVRTHPFGPGQIPLPFLGREDLVAFKLSFGRPRDWNDLADLVQTDPDLDFDVIEETLVARRGPQMHPRIARLRAMAARQR